MLSVHSVVQEVKHLRRFNTGFVGPQFWERSISLSQGTKAVLFGLAEFHLEALLIRGISGRDMDIFCVILARTIKDNDSEWSDMSTCRLLFEFASTMHIQLCVLV